MWGVGTRVELTSPPPLLTTFALQRHLASTSLRLYRAIQAAHVGWGGLISNTGHQRVRNSPKCPPPIPLTLSVVSHTWNRE